MCAPSQYLEDAISYARRAVEFDRDGQIDPAIYFYSVSSKLLLKAAGECPERQESLLAKSKEYNARATALEESKNKPAVDYKDESKQKQKRYKFLMQQALDADAAGLKDTAVGLYTDAIEFVTQNPELMQGELKELAIKALERAETLKGIKPKADDSPTQPIRQPLIPIKNVPSLHRGTSFNLKVTGSDTYSQEEKQKFQFAIPFSDRDGHLALSPKQQRDFHKWVRPDEICREPSILYGDYPNYFSIKQTIVSDCSFVASLAVSASYEKRFGKKLVTAIIYPRSKDKKPLYNPFEYRFACFNRLDPERIAIRTTDKDFNKNALFNSLETRMAKGDVLVSVATGEMSDSEAERTGLVATHAYAVMDVRTVNGVQLLQLKNPWSHLRWKGNYSELDIRHWTPELQRLLNYDPNSAAQFDNGVFWIDYESICAFFDVFYMNWNTELFKFTYCIHESWKAGSGPTKDLYTFGSNPQYSLDVGPDTTGAVWVLLTRHIMDIADFRENRISGEWKGVTAGGCGNNPQTYKNNPKIRLEIESPRNDNSLFVELKGPKQYQIGFDVTITSLADESVTAPFKTTSSGAFRSGYVILDLENIPAGVLHIIPSTFLPNQEGPFIMTVKCSAQFQLVRER
ncbi:calpain-7 [Holotrichia oblita]|uniref:Calpain-7 n=1 Tax=Holotrichia oblita TaxID=644536 RepID=A0ACB9SLX0_HOLOL|nr:calpain-7 [Holotrichia oblita]